MVITVIGAISFMLGLCIILASRVKKEKVEDELADTIFFGGIIMSFIGIICVIVDI